MKYVTMTVLAFWILESAAWCGTVNCTDMGWVVQCTDGTTIYKNGPNTNYSGETNPQFVANQYTHGQLDTVRPIQSIWTSSWSKFKYFRGIATMTNRPNARPWV